MSDETRKQGSVLPLGESLAGFLCSDGVFRVKSGEFRRATVGEWWQDKANGRVYCVNSEYPQDILVEPDFPAPSQTEGGGPDDTKQVSKEQGASPSVTPAVTKNVGDDRTDETDENYAFGNDAAIWICRHAGDYFPHPECPFDCDCKPVRYIRAATNQTQEAVADPKKDPAVDPVLFSLCVERVARSMVDDRATPLDRPLTVVVTPKAFAKYTVDLIAPLLLEAGAKAEREKFQARIERQRVLAYDAYRECEVQYDRETNAGESHEKVNEERMQVLDDTCGALWCLLNEPDEEDGEPDDWDVELVIGAEKRGAKQERERVKARVERLQPNHEPNFVVNASPEAKANFKGLDDMWRAVLAWNLAVSGE